MAADLSRIESFQYPAAHYGHLSADQQQALEAFKSLCLEQGYYIPASPAEPRSEASHDDETLLSWRSTDDAIPRRFLRARRFSPPEALKQFKETEDWRKEHGLDDLFTTIEVQEYEQTRRLYPQWLGRRDKRGIPVFLFEVAPLNSKNIASYEKQLAASRSTSSKVATKNLRLFALYESLTRFVQPLCSAIDRKHPETPISQSNNIVDISGVGLKQFWNLKNHMQDASQLATAHYPETLDRIFIIGAPAFFPTVWGWVKRWFDPITVSKIFILSKENVFPTLSQYIDPDSIPKKYGGNLDFEWGNMPVLEPAIEQAIHWESPAQQNGKNTFPIGPMKWEHGENGEMKAIAVGSEDGQPRRKLIFTIANPVGREAAQKAPIPNTPIDEAELRLTTDGTATQPTDAEVLESEGITGSTNTEQGGTASPAALKEQEGRNLPLRQGTSDTRYEQQHETHAAGQLADGTPYAAVNNHGQGDKTVTMEPGTVGQAPKDVTIPSQEPPAPGYVEQAKQVASTAAATVTSTVGSAVGNVAGLTGGSKSELKTEDGVVAKSPEQKELEKRIDAKDDPSIEGFLREKNTSTVV
ncbi:CRAL/TRIO domain-containing protein [Aaosphaeria arxii CBS 175.79]|uniref:CRAL/TRIO domain-containing protein n=1 Tax=Aaosphaeria arxii CBS 175.79 TaxID=1450172 RepID=A0A6A5XYZ8_9PLEO|nr:CRAL/TRIO domain-containing protein [Aaosphaeria arxii CBS 175.79]KAF2018518.1 CRAL/TRIO domain-containing protein [Aaosphaeria arxii CBS 175.79]